MKLKNQIPLTGEPDSPLSAFQALVKRYFQETLRFSPTRATELGIHEVDDKLESFSQESRRQITQTLQQYRWELEQIPREQLPLPDQIDARLMETEIAVALSNFETLRKWEKDPALYPEKMLESAYFLFGRSVPSKVKRMESLLSRMKQFPRLLKEAKENLNNPSEISTQIGLEMTDGAIEFLKGAPIRPQGISEKLFQDIQNAKEKSLEALDDYQAWLKNDLLLRSQGDIAVGEALLNQILKEHHLLPYTAQELSAIAEESFNQTVQAMETLAQTINPDKSWEEILRDEAGHPRPRRLISAYRKEMKRAKAFVEEKNLAPLPAAPDKLLVKKTPQFYQAFTPFAAYMDTPAFQKRGKGEFWITPVPPKLSKEAQKARLKEHAYHIIPLIAAHETYPGHHLQLSLLRNHASLLVKRATSAFSAEGWALYCEEMMNEQGFYLNPLSRLFQLKGQLWRIVRVMVDIGLHTRKFNFNQAVSLLVEKLHFPESAARSEVYRPVREPASLLCYFVGKREIMKLREAYRRQQNGTFSLFDFHRDFLRCGAVPIQLAEKQLLTPGALGA